MVAVSWPWIVMVAVVMGQTPMTHPTKAEIDAMIQRLGDDRFREREAATEQLWQMGGVTEPALRDALKHADPEIRVRAAMVLERFESGLYPDTSPESAELIRQYHQGNPREKMEVVQRLQKTQDWRTLMRLATRETDRSLRQQIASALRDEAIRKVTASIEAGDFAETERLLKISVSLNDFQARRQLVTLWLLQGTLPQQIAEIQRQTTLTKEEQNFLMELEEANQNSAAVDHWAEKLGDANLPLKLAVRRQRWSEAATLFDRQVLMDGSQPFNQLAYSAIYHRLAGNTDLADERLDNMRAVTERLDSQRWFSQEILLLHERLDEALEGLRTVRPTMALEIRCVRQEYEQGLAIALVKPGRAYDAAWFESLPYGDAGDDAAKQLNRRHLLALQAGFFLHQIGHTKDAEAIFAYLRTLEQGTADASMRWRRSELCRIQMRLGLVAQAFADAEQMLDKATDPQLCNALFGEQGTSALSWHAFLRGHQPGRPAREHLQTVRMLLRPTAQEKSETSWRALVEAATATLVDDKPNGKFLRLGAIADVYLARGMRHEACEMLLQQELNSALYVRCGDLLRAEKRFVEAADCYAKVPVADRERPLAIYLQGVALAADGRKDEAAVMHNKALLLAASNFARQLLFQGLQARQLTSDVARVRDVWLRTSPELVANLANELGKSWAEDDPLRAAQSWEQMLVNLTDTSSSLVQDAGYVMLPHSIHQAKAKGAVMARDKAAWRQELAACRHLLPNHGGLVDELLPLLQKAEWHEEIDALYRDQRKQLQALSKQYPQSARLSNSLAWTCAIARRDLDEALVQAKRTLELAPDVPSYLDTLAEVHFARGEYQQAVDVQRRAVELAEDAAAFEERLQRFEAALKR